MIGKLLNAFVIGLIFVLLLDFLLFVGLKLNYFDLYGIDEYFNIIFVDNQSYLLLLVSSLTFGYMMLYAKRHKIYDRIYIVLIVLFATTFYQPVGESIGTFFFTQKNQKLEVLDINITTDILYQGRKFIYIKKPHLSNATKILKEDVNTPL